jgi:hypothetical protein
MERHLGAEWAVVKRELEDDSNVISEVIRRLVHEQHLPAFRQIIFGSLANPWSTEEGSPIGTLVHLRHQLKPAPHFLVADDLVALLEHTDIAEDLPLSMMNLPFDRFYLELGRGRLCKATLPNIASGNHIFEGAYIEKGNHLGQPTLYLVLTGSPLGKADAADDATFNLALSLANLELPIAQVLRGSRLRTQAQARAVGQVVSPEEWETDVLEAVLLLAKALLYIGLPGTRRELHPERSDALRSLQGVKSPAKRGKAERRLSKLYDHILIGPQPEHRQTATKVAQAGNVSAHWRRGHYRMQAHGPHHSLRKLLFIEAVLVGAAAQSPVPAQATYHVV